MLYYVKEVNSMLRSMAFKKKRKEKMFGSNAKASPNCLGVHVSDIRVVTSPHSSNNFRKKILDFDL